MVSEGFGRASEGSGKFSNRAESTDEGPTRLRGRMNRHVLRPTYGYAYGRIYEQIYRRTDRNSPHVLQDIIPFGAAAQK